jgi:hypothetical protein
MKFLLCTYFAFLALAGDEKIDQVQTNETVIDSLIVAVVSEKIKEISRENKDSLAIDASALDIELAHYLQIVIGNLAAEKSFIVMRNYNQTSSFQGLILVIKSFKTKVSYSKSNISSYLGGKRLQRTIMIEIKGQIYQVPSDIVLSSIDTAVTYEDGIDYDSIDEMEKSNYHFTKGEQGYYSFWDRIFEPALVITSIAALVYLFFTQRT